MTDIAEPQRINLAGACGDIDPGPVWS